MNYVKMGSRFGLETIIEETSLERLQASGIGVEVSAKVAWLQASDDCKESACDAQKHATKQRHMQEEAAGLKCAEEGGCGYEASGLKPLFDDLERVPVAKTIVVDGAKGTAYSPSWPRRSESQFNGWAFAGDVELKKRGARARQAAAIESGLERAGAVSASVSHQSEREKMDSFSESSESTKLISLGAPPQSSAMEWAQASDDAAEDMPISFQLRPICELVKLALERDFVDGVRRRLVDRERLGHRRPAADPRQPAARPAAVDGRAADGRPPN